MFETIDEFKSFIDSGHNRTVLCHTVEEKAAVIDLFERAGYRLSEHCEEVLSGRNEYSRYMYVGYREAGTPHVTMWSSPSSEYVDFGDVVNILTENQVEAEVEAEDEFDAHFGALIASVEVV